MSNTTTPTPTTSFELGPARAVEDGQFERIVQQDVLAPGYYWRLKNDVEVPHPHWSGRCYTLQRGDVHLLLDIFEFEGVPHTAVLLAHPRDGGHAEYRILIADFLANLEPAHDAEAVRTAEQAQIMAEVADLQEEMARAQDNPLALPGVREAAEAAVEKLEQRLVAEASAAGQSQAQRAADLRKLHRRAARRSEAAGNPLVARSVTISDQVGLMIAGGIDSQGLRDLTAEARRRVAIAEASAAWLKKRVDDLGHTLKRLTPYYAEKGHVALARAKKSISYVKEVTQGLTSLKLYTGDGVDVVTVLEGASAGTEHPLMLLQGKRFMDEELAVWADVDDRFDWQSQGAFFDALKTSPSLLNQVLPGQRCVVSMAVTRRTIAYSREMTAYEVALNQIRNRAVFLLVRDGQNVHAVYSGEPSHEAAERLFPTQQEIERPFQGIDGSTIGLQDVAFGKSTERFEATSLHYLRFLILLCGLDHRMKLFGEFYPPEAGLQFMSKEFQQRYFWFVQDEDAAHQLDDSLEDVADWIDRCNKAVRSGSRIVVAGKHALAAASQQVQRIYSLQVDEAAVPEQFVVSRAGSRYYITVPTRDSSENSRGSARAWLDDAKARSLTDDDWFRDWFLCLDAVRLEVVQRYIHSRTARAGNIAWLRTFKRVEAVLLRERAQQAELRQALAKAALDAGVLGPDEVGEAIEVALATWRAARRGADAPASTDTRDVHELLTLMYPAHKLAHTADTLLAKLIQTLGVEPLMLQRTGTTRLVLYVVASQEDKEPYAQGVQWGWVKRVLIDVLKTKLSVASTSLVWLQKDKPNPAETPVREWPALANWIHPNEAPCPLRWLSEAKEQIAAAAASLGNVLAGGRAAPTQSGLPAEWADAVTAQSKEALRRRSYFEIPYVVVPIGIYQQSSTSPLKFLYAVAQSAHVMHRYGSEEQWGQYKLDVLRNSPRRAAIAFEQPMKWSLMQTSEPVTKVALLIDQIGGRRPVWANQDTHERGGFTRARRRHSTWGRATRAERRAVGGAPHHQTVQVELSWNRAVDSLMGVAPHLRRAFYANAMERARRMHSFGEPENRKAEMNRRYVAVAPAHHYLSELIWSPAKGRSMASNYFAVSRSTE